MRGSRSRLRRNVKGDRVAVFGEKSGSGPGWINGGVYALRRRAVALLGSPASIERDLFSQLVESQQQLGMPSDGFFIDMGLPEMYAEAQQTVPAWWWSRSGGSAREGR